MLVLTCGNTPTVRVELRGYILPWTGLIIPDAALPRGAGTSWDVRLNVYPGHGSWYEITAT